MIFIFQLTGVEMIVLAALNKMPDSLLTRHSLSENQKVIYTKAYASVPK